MPKRLWECWEIVTCKCCALYDHENNKCKREDAPKEVKSVSGGSN